MRDIEIQQEAEPEITQAKITKQLAAKHWKDRLDRLQLHDDLFLDEEIDAVAVFDRQGFVADRHLYLPAGAKRNLFQFIDQTRLIRALKQSWPENRMDL